MLHTFDVKLTGTSGGELHSPIVKLQKMGITLRSDDGVTWENNAVKLELTNSMSVEMSCRAISGTDWTFTISENGKEILNKKGQTGDSSPNASTANTTIQF